MSEPKLTNAQIRERRREAALKAARTRAAKQASAEAAEPVAEPQPDAPTGRQLLERARSIGREADLYYHAHLARWPHRPSAWPAAQRAALDAFLDRFIRPDGTPQPVPHRTRRSPR
jgi:hypothetical protein